MKLPHCCPSTSMFSSVALSLVVSTGILVSLGAFSSTKESESKMLRHVVLFKFKESSSKEDVAKVIEGFRNLPKKISEVADFEFGTDNSPEKLADGFTHCFFLSFKNEKDRDAYLPHAAHKEFVDVALPHVEKVLVVDYWAGK